MWVTKCLKRHVACIVSEALFTGVVDDSLIFNGYFLNKFRYLKHIILNSANKISACLYARWIKNAV